MVQAVRMDYPSNWDKREYLASPYKHRLWMTVPVVTGACDRRVGMSTTGVVGRFVIRHSGPGGTRHCIHRVQCQAGLRRHPTRGIDVHRMMAVPKADDVSAVGWTYFFRERPGFTAAALDSTLTAGTSRAGRPDGRWTPLWVPVAGRCSGL